MNENSIVTRVILGGLVFNDNKILIIQRSSDDESYPGMWEIPSGKKEPLEKAAVEAVREIKEETGLDALISEVVNVFNFVNEKTDEIRDATQINFLAELKGQSDVKLSSEHQSFAWISEGEIGNYNLSEETKNSILMAFKKLN